MRHPRSLASRLVLTVAALVIAGAALIGTATTLAMRDYLNDQLDAKVLGRAIAPPQFGTVRGSRPPRDLRSWMTSATKSRARWWWTSTAERG